MPPKPNERRKALAFYNIDFTLANQVSQYGSLESLSVSNLLKYKLFFFDRKIRIFLIFTDYFNHLSEVQYKLAGQSPSSSVSSLPSSTTQKDPVARKKEFLRRRKMQADSQGASKVIEVRSVAKLFYFTNTAV